MMTSVRLQVVESSPLRHVLALPGASEPQAEPLPVLCFLHGYDEGPPANIEDALTRHGPLRWGNPAGAVGRFMVIAPQLPVRGDLWYAYAEEVRFLVQDTQNRHNGDRARSYLTGFSFGGNGVFDLAIRQPGFWAALWAVDPTRIPGQDPERPLCLAFGTLARARKEAFIRALHLNPYNKNPGSDRIHLDEGEDHVGAARRAYGDDRLYDWLLSKQLT